MTQWIMLTLIGEDRPGIVAQVTAALYQDGWALGEASMIRLGGNFTIMLMVSGQQDPSALENTLRPVVDALGLRLHIDPVGGGLHRHRVPNLQVRVCGADRAGIVAQITGALAAKGFNILELESDVAGTQEQPIYLMNIQGDTNQTVEDIQAAVDALGLTDMDVSVEPIETLVG